MWATLSRSQQNKLGWDWWKFAVTFDIVFQEEKARLEEERVMKEREVSWGVLLLCIMFVFVFDLLIQ